MYRIEIIGVYLPGFSSNPRVFLWAVIPMFYPTIGIAAGTMIICSPCTRWNGWLAGGRGGPRSLLLP